MNKPTLFGAVICLKNSASINIITTYGGSHKLKTFLRQKLLDKIFFATTICTREPIMARFKAKERSFSITCKTVFREIITAPNKVLK